MVCTDMQVLGNMSNIFGRNTNSKGLLLIQKFVVHIKLRKMCHVKLYKAIFECIIYYY